MASPKVCFVRLFFSSKVKTGSPLMKSPMSSERCVSSRLYRSWRVTLNWFSRKRRRAASFWAEGVP